MSDLPPSDRDRTELVLRPGTHAFGRYTLADVVGEGGMGVVWRARDEKLEREVALKFLPDRVRRDPEAVRDLKRETRRCLELTHPNIVRVYDFVEDSLAAAIAMEFVPGRSLSALKAARDGGCFDAADLEPLVRQLCAALDYAHTQAGVVHRDLKPGNLLVTDAGVLKIVDFGIARSLLETHTRLTGDLRGTAGTLAFMSPQQLESKTKPAPADDIYALGATLYDLLTGKPPFFGADLFSEIRHATPAPLAERRAALENTGGPIPPAWEETIIACLAKRAEDRPRSAGEVAARLRLSAAGPPAAGGPSREDAARIPAQPERTPSATAPKKRRWRLLAALAGAVAIAIAGVVFWPQGGAPERSSRGNEAGPKRAAGGKADRLVTAAATKETEPPVVPAPAAAAALSREFTVAVDPPDAGARLWLGPQSDVAVPAGGRAILKDLPDGEHELTVQAAGYQPLTTRVTVKEGRGSAEARLVAVRGVVEIAARPGTVVTAVDARGRETRMGSVPPGGTLKAEDLLTIGSYSFRFTHQDCAPVEAKEVELALGRVAKVAPAQTPLPGELRVFSVPTGAEVAVNGKILGTTPATLTAQPSETELRVEVYARGYRRNDQTVTLKPRETRTLNVGTLVAESGDIELRMADAGLRNDTKLVVRIDGKPVDGAAALSPRTSTPRAGGGASPREPLRLDGLEIGERMVEIAHPDYEPWSQRVNVRDQQTARVEVKLVPKPAVLTLAVAGPRDYVLLVGGKPVAVAGGRATVPALQELALELTAKGYKSAARRLSLPANGSHTWELTLEKLRGPEAGQPWTIPELGLTLMPIAAGTFTMGSENGSTDEKPLTRVTITKPYWLGKTEVTQREWQGVMGSNPSQFKGDDRPVEQISWEEAMAFCRKLTERERAADRLPAGFAYLLPTEAQWEHGCRAGTTGDYAGDLDTMAWYSNNSSSQTHPVGQKRANAWGLHDMHGNVWEWCLDWYADKLPGGSVRDPTGAASGSLRVDRGGCWDFDAVICRSAFRGGNDPGYRWNNLGFRVALSSVP